VIAALDLVLPTVFGFGAALYLWLSVRVSRASSDLSNNIISYFLFLIGMILSA
jgi:hypothetical protein